MAVRIGIDAGGTLTKVAYEEKERIHVKTYPNGQMERLLHWLQFTFPETRLVVTGGNSSLIKENSGHQVETVDEFTALTDGTRYLLTEEKLDAIKDFILVSIGTGTSIFRVTPDSYERLLGSGIGGGTWYGLSIRLTGERKFPELVKLAKDGDRSRNDLLVKDIYSGGEAPPISGELTAANFGKAHIMEDATPADHMASLTQFVGETLIMLAGQAAAAQEVETIVFTGSTLNGNIPLKNVLSGFQDMLPYDPVFLDRGGHAGAIGCLLV
ncbi:type II pantothenate kinase [Virgibacillus xinjiangensis]|uniref:Type II pantothenate kinase n=1 Tax=Virgibacillus xinjiangensis TaxID=393090 RepID=A0ABV7CZ40_9BACI